MVEKPSLRAWEDGLDRGQAHEQPFSQQQHGGPPPPIGYLPPSGQEGKLTGNQIQGLSPGIIDAKLQVLPTVKIKRWCSLALKFGCDFVRQPGKSSVAFHT